MPVVVGHFVECLIQIIHSIRFVRNSQPTIKLNFLIKIPKFNFLIWFLQNQVTKYLNKSKFHMIVCFDMVNEKPKPHKSTGLGRNLHNPTVDELLAVCSDGFKTLTNRLATEWLRCFLRNTVSHLKHRGEAVLCNTCANAILLNKSNKSNNFKGVTVLQKPQIKQINRNLILVKSLMLL